MAVVDNAGNFEELVDRFVKSAHDPKTSVDIATGIQDIRNLIEAKGREYEVKEMIKYHTNAARLSPSEEEKNTHLASVVVLEQRLNFLQTHKQAPPELQDIV